MILLAKSIILGGEWWFYSGMMWHGLEKIGFCNFPPSSKLEN